MISLLAIIFVAIVSMLAVAMLTAICGGIGFILTCGDIVVAIGIIALLIRFLWRKAKKNK